jgi:predicted protein tyrosine phosphatase
MGYGAYSHEAHQALTRAREKRPVQELFTRQSCHPLMNPHGVGLRESRDSDEHPESLAIAIALDVTGSMGQIPEKLARRDLPGFMQRVTDLGIEHPQVLFMAIGDATSDRAPLQVGQFESTAPLMDQWLTSCWIEAGGGLAGRESYELALYFAARHIDLDCFRVRGQRGYLFLTGDERPYDHVSRNVVRDVLGHEIESDIPVAAIVEEAQHLFEPFFLIPNLERRRVCERAWRDLLGDRVVCLESPDDTCLVAAGLIALCQGSRDLDQVAAHLADAGTDREVVGRIARALMPFASACGRDGAPEPALATGARFPPVDAGSNYRRRPA